MLKAHSVLSKMSSSSRALFPAAVSSRKSTNGPNQKLPKAVIFDMGGVILPSPLYMFRDFENINGLQKGSVTKVIVSSGSQGAWGQLEMGKLNLTQFSEAFSKELSVKIGKNVDVTSLVNEMRKGIGSPFPVMIDAIQCVKGEGIKTALLTNNWFLDDRKTQTLCPLDKNLFDVIVESCIVGNHKPDPKIFQTCLQELQVQPEEAVFLDDLGQNLKAAQLLGIQTIKVTSPDQAISDLEKLLGYGLRQFVPGTTHIPGHLEINILSLENYLKSLGLQDSSPPVVKVFEHGQSNPTYYVSYGGQKMVLRKKPPGQLLPSAHAVDREYKVMSAVGKDKVSVPCMIAFCQDESVLGTQFYLMDYLEGRIFKSIKLPEVPKESRREIVMAMVDVLSKIHSVDIDKVGLSDYGKKGQFCERNFKRWATQYELSKTHEIPSMSLLMSWLSDRMPEKEKVSVIHGDFRLDNLMFHTERSEVIAAIDWELSTLGDPLIDLANSVLAYYSPPDSPLTAGLVGEDLESLGLPTISEILNKYCLLTKQPPIDNWDFYVAYSFFRGAAILQGVYKRAISGQSSSSNSKRVGAYASVMADIGWSIASKSSLKPNKTVATSNTSATQTRQFSTISFTGRRPVMSTLSRSLTSGSSASSQVGLMAVSVEGLSPAVQDLHRRVKQFIQTHVLPLEDVHKEREAQKGDRWTVMPEIEAAKAKAKAEGLWNLFLPLESDPDKKYGAGLTNLEYAFLCEEMGKCMLAPEVFNCSAPDTGNMETLVKYGNEEQKEKWLKPLLDGKIRSCFAMTEPAVASSDATNIESSIRREGDHYIMNGHKWWTSGALDPRCKICIFMGKTNTLAEKHLQQSMILVPMDTPGIKIVRPLTVFGFDDAPEGHGEVIFENVRVPVSNILLGEGRGFEIAQGRLGPGRIHHCMRLIGHAERALSLMIDRTMNRVAFGKPLAAQGSIQQDIAKSRIQIEQCRLLVLKAAYMMDLYGNKVAAPEIAMIKVAAPNMALDVIDRSIQAHGGAGLDHTLPLAHSFATARTLRLADGPDEVHLRTIAKMQYAKAKKANL
ncbi:acyl-CoA dehydrogenase family member 10-like isoform X2 [Biomphalaria glabrata]|uniref:Acyl-CoA dehydrogenase family member 10-like isoform X2 n=1 Tax=Biomphalaria glabrata TaxID=6526 RepID=A0A9W2YGR8_BIOGL|nr:acyl-CoA dehydrogenase family member 10-like isoform X2 [Biomphalaria glabrata]